MTHIATTPFGARPVSACLVEQMAAATQPPQATHADKWTLYDDLRDARAAFGVTDRDLSVLYALLSFHPGKTLSDNQQLVVFPSNAVLATRTHGMAESTLRRHIAALVQAGLLRRQDSPNGKRYACKDRDGAVELAFGFDLRPLLERAEDIQSAAQAARDANAALRRARAAVSCKKRDAAKLLAYVEGAEAAPDCSGVTSQLAEVCRMWRRKLSVELLERISHMLDRALSTLRRYLHLTEKTVGIDGQNERQHTDSNKDSSDLELTSESEEDRKADAPTLPLALVVKACPDILPYTDGPLRHWHELVALAGNLRGMMGISPNAWSEAQRVMGPEVAAITVVGILQRVADINSPGGYLRALTRRADQAAFSPGPMIMSLLKAKC